jgi:hypothetical protein
MTFVWPFATGHFGSHPLSRASASRDRAMWLTRPGSSMASRGIWLR